MRTTLNLDDQTMRSLLSITHAHTKTQAVTQAIQDYVLRRQLEELKSLQGKLHLKNRWQQMERAEIQESRSYSPP